MKKTTDASNALHHLAGPLFLAIAALAYNAIMRSLKRPSISAGVRWLVDQKMGAEIAGGVIGGLIAHWLLNDGKGENRWNH